MAQFASRNLAHVRTDEVGTGMSRVRSDESRIRFLKPGLSVAVCRVSQGR